MTQLKAKFISYQGHIEAISMPYYNSWDQYGFNMASIWLQYGFDMAFT